MKDTAHMAKKTTATASKKSGPAIAAAAKAATPADNKSSAPAPFSFDIEEGLEIPQDIGRAASAIELPFKDRFEKMTKNGMSFWLPDTFWTSPSELGGRGVDPEKATSTYIRSKVRTSFNNWKAKDKEGRANRDLLMVPRKKGDNNGKGGVFEEPGFTVFMLVK